MLQKCSRCKADKGQSGYHKSAWGGKGKWCIECHREYNRDRSKRLWAEKVARGEVGQRGRKPDPETPVRQAVRRALRAEEWALTQEVWEVKKTLEETNQVKRKFRERVVDLGLNFDEIWTRYGNHDRKCEICQIHEDSLEQRLHIDHDHETGEFRGFLCSACNRSLGQLGDTEEALLRALAYLRNRA